MGVIPTGVCPPSSSREQECKTCWKCLFCFLLGCQAPEGLADTSQRLDQACSCLVAPSGPSSSPMVSEVIAGQGAEGDSTPEDVKAR